MNNKKIIISVIILNYFKAKRVVENIKLLEKQEGNFKLQFILFDNSCDKEEYKILDDFSKNATKRNPDFYENSSFTVASNEKNNGYTKGNNIGAKCAKGDFILILNPDILIKDKNVISELVEYLKNNSDVGIIGPKQINDNGKAPLIVRRFPNLFAQITRRTFLRNIPGIKNIIQKDECRDLDLDLIQSVDWIQSSCFMLSKNLWDKIGGFDENYKIFLGDPEMCFQSWKLGKKVIYFPKVKVVADGKRASGGGIITFFKSWVLRQHFIDSLKYFFKHSILGFFFGNPRKKYFYKKNKNIIG